MSNITKKHRIRDGWALTKSSWNALLLDKKLIALPLAAFATTVLALIVFAGAVLAISLAVTHGQTLVITERSQLGVWGIAILIGLSLLTAIIVNFFSAAVIYGVTERFRGNTPTLKSSLAGARRKFWPLAAYSVMMATVGLALQALEERLPFAGRIAVTIFDGAWSIANVFALPVIVLNDDNVHPLEATKKSVAVIKQVWGEGIVVNSGIAAIGGLAFLGYFLLMILATVGTIYASAALHMASVNLIPMYLVSTLPLMALFLVLALLGSIAKAALYHYATTNVTPASFNESLLKAAMTPKKARKIFG